MPSWLPAGVKLFALQLKPQSPDLVAVLEDCLMAACRGFKAIFLQRKAQAALFDFVNVVPDTKSRHGCLQEFREAVRFAAAVPDLQAPLTSLLWELAVKPALAPRLAAAAVAAALMPALSAHQVRQCRIECAAPVWLVAAAVAAGPTTTLSAHQVRQTELSAGVWLQCSHVPGGCCFGCRADAHLVSRSGGTDRAGH